MGTNDPPNDPRQSSDPGSADRTLSAGGSGDAAAGQIGPYRLLQMIGEGGMGEVWLPEQKAPIRRTVALKLIKAGMDTKAVVARFESERQALALMDHPNIAQVYDAGSTTEGRPYFAMEYVPGLPITEYCDKHQLTVKERLELFMQVCDGVQHAHQKAIIHRDLKPSNVLVLEQDNKAVPKIIDFGLAKAMAQRLTDKTMFTELGALVGTPEYMSPEQADLREQTYLRVVVGLTFMRSIKEARRAGTRQAFASWKLECPICVFAAHDCEKHLRIQNFCWRRGENVL